MRKFWYISDLHIDNTIDPCDEPKFIKKFTKHYNYMFNKDVTTDDVLILAGDITHYVSQYKFLFNILSKMFYKILVVSGNHELYFITKNMRSEFVTYHKKIDKIKSICEEYDNIKFLNGDIINIDGIMIGGTMGWYDLSLGDLVGYSEITTHNFWKDYMNDGKLINDGETREIITQMYSNNSKITLCPHTLFKKEIDKIENIYNKVDIMITHIPPLSDTDKEYQNFKKGDIFYWFRADKYLGTPKYWVCGHRHKCYINNVNGTTVVQNAIGSLKENNKPSLKYFTL